MLSAIDNLKFHLIDKPAAMGVSTLSEGWVDRGFDALASAAHDARLDAIERPHLPNESANLAGPIGSPPSAAI